MPSHDGDIFASAFAKAFMNDVSALPMQAGSTGMLFEAALERHLNFPPAFFPDAFRFDAEHFCTGVPPAIALPSMSTVPSSATPTTVIIVFIWLLVGLIGSIPPCRDLSYVRTR